MRAAFIVIIILSMGFLVFVAIKRIPTLTTTRSADIDVTLTGTLTEVPSTSEYSFVLKEDHTSTGINSMKVDLKKYANKRVSITGQYSGSVLYVDTIMVSP